MIIRLTFFLFTYISFHPFIQAETVHVAVASNFAEPMKKLVVEFEQQSKHKVVLSFASSGKIFAQIKHGAPFDIFLSADQDKVIKLEQANLTAKNSMFTYALGQLYLWSVTAKDQKSLWDQLTSKEFNKLALANPKLAPYGKAAVEVLNVLKLTEDTRSSWVIGENIAQTYQFVNSGNASLGFVAASQINNKKHSYKGFAWKLPENYYNKISQDAVLLKRAKSNAAAVSLMMYLRSDKAQTIIKNYGYNSALEAKKGHIE